VVRSQHSPRQVGGWWAQSGRRAAVTPKNGEGGAWACSSALPPPASAWLNCRLQTCQAPTPSAPPPSMGWKNLQVTGVWVHHGSHCRSLSCPALAGLQVTEVSGSSFIMNRTVEYLRLPADTVYLLTGTLLVAADGSSVSAPPSGHSVPAGHSGMPLWGFADVLLGAAKMLPGSLYAWCRRASQCVTHSKVLSFSLLADNRQTCSAPGTPSVSNACACRIHRSHQFWKDGGIGAASRAQVRPGRLCVSLWGPVH